MAQRSSAFLSSRAFLYIGALACFLALAAVPTRSLAQAACPGAFTSQWGDEFLGPNFVAVDSSGPTTYVYITDFRLDVVKKFDTSGNFITQWGRYGTGNGQFNQPYGVAVDPAGNVWVVDSGNARVQEFTSSGAYVTQYGSYSVGLGNGLFEKPVGIAIANYGGVTDIWVTDSAQNEVQVFDTSLAPHDEFGGTGSGSGQFNGPQGIAYNPNGLIYIADQGNVRVVGCLPTQPTFDYTVALPANAVADGVAVDLNEKVYVSDNNRGTIYEYDPTLTTLMQNFTPSQGGGVQIAGLALDPLDNLYAAIFNVQEVQQFKNISPSAPQATWGAPITATGQFNGGNNFYDYTGYQSGPSAVAYGNGYNFVADPGNSRVEVFYGGTYISQYNTYGSTPTTFTAPLGVAVDSGGTTLFVADTGNNKVHVFFSGTWQGDLGTSGPGFSFPTAVACNSAGTTVFVADWGHDTVDVYSLSSPAFAVVTFTGPTGGAGPNTFNNLSGIAVDSTGQTIYACDQGNQRVVRFTLSGGYLDQWNTPCTSGIAVDPSGYIFVGDSATNGIDKFTNAGTPSSPLTSWGGLGVGSGHFGDGLLAVTGGVTIANPEGLCLGVPSGGNETLYACDTNDSLVQTFSVCVPVPTPTPTPCGLNITGTSTLPSGVYSECSVTVESGGTLNITGPVTLNLTGGNLLVNAGGTLNAGGTVVINAASGGSFLLNGVLGGLGNTSLSVTLANGSFTEASGGLVDFFGTGAAGGSGGTSGSGSGAGGGTTDTTGGAGGAGHGGAGGNGGVGASEGIGGAKVDNSAGPTLMGGGGGAGAVQSGGSGGGYLNIQAPSGQVSFGGIVTVNGNNGANVAVSGDGGGGGGGAGGAVYVQASTIVLSGSVSAVGGSGGSGVGTSRGGGGGGGGMVNLCSSNVSTNNAVFVQGGGRRNRFRRRYGGGRQCGNRSLLHLGPTGYAHKQPNPDAYFHRHPDGD